MHVQVLLVAGGYDGGNILSSTEILVTLAGVWRTVGPLPTAVDGLSGATLDNTVYMLGEWCTDIFSVCHDVLPCFRGKGWYQLS